MPSPWLAVGAETDPLTRARELQRSWEHLLAEGALGPPDLPAEATAGLRPTIVESWRRSVSTGLDPTKLVPPIEADQAEVRERWLEHPLGSLTHVLDAQLRSVAEQSQSLVVVTDASGLLMHLDGAEWLKERAREMNFLEGARFTEAADGTNGIGTALAADRPLQVFAFEHFNQCHHQWVCSGAPVHDPVSGRVVGLIDLSSIWKIAHPRSLELVTTAARTMERCLLDARRDQDVRLRRRYSDLRTRSTDLLVDHDGYVLDGDEPRRARPLDIPEGGGEIFFDNGTVAVAEPVGQGEAYLVRRPGSGRAKAAPVEALNRAERRARELATEQAALRQVATLVARVSSPDQLFTAVAKQAARIFDVPVVKLVRYEPDSSVVVGGFSEGSDDPWPLGSQWLPDSPGVIAAVRQSGRPARVEDYAHMPGQVAAVARRSGIRSAVASPIAVEGRLWGAMVVASPRADLAEDAEPRLTDFTELVATAIANAESRAAVGRLAEEQGALRRVATLVARGASPGETFSAVSNEVGQVFDAEVALARFEPDGTEMVVVGLTDGIPVVSVGTRWKLEDFLASTTVYRTGRPARNDHTGHRDASGPVADSLRQMRFISTVAAPIVVEGRLWGTLTVSNQRKALPPDTEERVAKFTELVATAIANTESRAALGELIEEQTALRRIATLVADGVRPEEIFSAVTNEIGLLFASPQAYVGRFAPDGSSMVVVGLSERIRGISIGTRWELEDYMAAARVYRTGRPARVERSDFEHASGPMVDVLREIGAVASVAAPIVVEGHLWGFVTVTCMERLAADAEERLENFTELLATAIANAESRAELAASRARVIAATDDTRRRIERDLHDGAQQRLVTLAIALRRAEAKVPAGLDELRGEFRRIAEGLSTAGEGLREISRGIHPSILTEGGLEPALKAIGRRSAVRVKLDASIERRLPDHVEVAAYYTVSEALTNASKHANATCVWISLSVGCDVLHLAIRDDGVGGADSSRGSGLTGLRDRIEALGGTIGIDSPREEGTLIEVEIPIVGPADRTAEPDGLPSPANTRGPSP